MRKSCNGIGRSGIAHGRGNGNECLDYPRSVCARAVYLGVLVMCITIRKDKQ